MHKLTLISLSINKMSYSGPMYTSIQDVVECGL